LDVLVIDSEPACERDNRRLHGRPTACGSFIDTLKKISPELSCHRVAPVDGETLGNMDFSRFGAAFFSGSPLHFYEDTREVRDVLAFSRTLFESGLPCFGSCAGLQIAVMVSGGTVGPKARQTELGISRGIRTTLAGERHWLLRGRSPSFDATSLHEDEVKVLPAGAILLASSSKTHVQAVEMRVEASMFWGTQYHPEISLREIAMAIRYQAETAISHGFSAGVEELDTQLAKFEALDCDHTRKDLAWELGLDSQTIDFSERTLEIQNFVGSVAK
jgi:GMP synthase (glutamine-hydrolysing)